MDLLFQTILPFLLILNALIIAHEMGHYFTAKLFGIKVLEAGIGYPPRAWGFEWRGIIYSINWLPLGGFVRLLGEEDPEDPQSLAAAAAWKRLIVLGSGAGVNFVLPIILFGIMFMVPRDVASGPAAIGTVVPDSPAAAAGLQSGDVLLEIEGRTIKNASDAIRAIQLNQGRTIDFVVRRDDPIEGSVTHELAVKSRWDPPTLSHTVVEGESVSDVARILNVPADAVRAKADIEYLLEEDEEITVITPDGPITYRVRLGDTVASVARRLDVEQEDIREAAGLPDPEYIEPGTKISFSQGATGITVGNLPPFFTEKESFPPWEAFPKGWTATWESLILARNQVLSAFHGGAGPQVSGPVGIAQATGEVVEEEGWQPLLELAALLSINLAIINILPLPMLDGGRIAFVLLEVARRGKRIAPEKEAIVHLVGLALILTMAVAVTYVDIARIISGGSLFEQ